MRLQKNLQKFLIGTIQALSVCTFSLTVMAQALTPGMPAGVSGAGSSAATMGSGVSSAPSMPMARPFTNQNQSSVNASNPESAANAQVKPDSNNPDLKTNDARSLASRNAQLLGLDTPTPNAFQTFIAQSTGKIVPIYGQSLFLKANPFAAIESVPVPANYVIGPGDELLVKIYSAAFDVDQRMVVNREGAIVLPKIGPVNMAGTRMDQIENRLKGALNQILTDFSVSVSMGQLRGIEIYVTGQARAPGKYVVSSVSTLLNALFATGGPTSNGSMRHIQLVRDSKVVAQLDLYEFLTTGKTAKDARLLPGDVINIPPIGPQVALLGATQNQAVYELLPKIQGGTQLTEVITHAGGLQAFTSPLQASLERLDSEKSRPLSAQMIALDRQGLSTQLKDGDIITLFPIKPAFENAISLRILGSPSIRVPIELGSKIKDVIPDREALLTSSYFLRRFNPPDPKNGTSDDLNRIRTNTRLDQINWDLAIIERINPKDFSPQIISFNLGQAILNGDPQHNIELFAGDTLTVFSHNDMQVPVERQIRTVKLQGEVKAPGIYELKPGETLNQLIRRAGGLSRNAYLFGTELSRISVRENQRKNIDRVIKQLEQSILVQAQSANLSSPENLALQNTIRQQSSEAMRTKINYLRNATPNGRVALAMDIDEDILPEILLEDGDEVRIPNVPSAVQVAGAIYNDNALIYRPGMRVSDYLKMAGPTMTAEESQVSLLRADGSVYSDYNAGWFSSVNRQKVMPGDTIIVPEKVVRETGYSVFMRGLRDWSQVLGQLGLTAAAIKVLRD